MSTNTEDLVIGEGDVAEAQELHQRAWPLKPKGPDRRDCGLPEAVAESP